MQTRKKPWTILLSLTATLAFLFGGWFLYQKMEIEEPIRHVVGQMKSAQLTQLKVEKDQVSVMLKVTKPEQFPEEYRNVSKSLGEIVQNKQIVLSISNKKNQLKEVWRDGVFAFTEAVDLHQYSKIPMMLADWKQKYHLDEAVTQMDEANVYVYLKRGQDEFFVLVPRYPYAKEVTTNG
jgi:hypothetical protein